MGMSKRKSSAQKTREAFDRFWCRCDPQRDNVTFHDDNPRSKVCIKHHWTCDDCGKVRQVG